jgi:hypothetical protein
VVDLVLAAWLGGAACYVGVLSTPTPTRLPWFGLLILALMWPASIALAHGEAENHRGRS